MKQMKNFKIVLAVAALVAASLSSCSKLDDGNEWLGTPNALVTVKTNGADTYFQLDEKTTLEPKGWSNPFKREVRALLRYEENKEASRLYSKTVKVVWIDSLRTKPAVLYDEDFKNAKDDGGLYIYDDWVTCCEDGYLTLHFASWVGQSYSMEKKVHYLHLAIDPETLDLYLRHDRNGDNEYGAPADGFIAFKIDDLLPNVKDGETLTLHWKDYDGDRSAKVKYSSRFSLPQESQVLD